VDYPVALIVAVVLTASSCAARHRPTSDFGVPACSERAADALLSVDALQCWFAASHGRWRTLEHDSHLDVLVVEVEAWDLRDAEEIGRRFVANQRSAFAEILVYVHPGAPRQHGRVRRVQWTRETGFNVLDFDC
jgi:hypothetical protein